MSSDNIIIYMIAVCVLFAFIIFFSDKFKFIGKFIFNGVVGSVGIYIINYLLASFGIFVGINFITFAVIGLLGFPGFVSLYIINAFL